MSPENNKTIAHTYAPKEGFKSTYSWFESLKDKGLNPLCITMDGEQFVMKAIRLVWPFTKIQRCLYHILRQGLSWLRTFPKTQAGAELRALLMRITAIKSFKDRDLFFDLYRNWYLTYRDAIKKLPNTTVAFKDLKKTMALIHHALPDLFHYLNDSNIPSTTNLLESFHSRLKADYRRHRGLTNTNKINYLSWYCFFNNSNIS
ncbi:MAG: hypothetical protein A3G33_04905 [Omnitrophica bacterium RIFCSPLOWO2_12_FULL_44_17]|uniref:Mutator family transposase n=1 Tax=Candidatus Danuiimicrobium aquiferis TaxID=1801832 RepID=A0A1G1KXJ3_9BACT|nr:MAG: hypothetical protein A3E74_07845 [Omnitrophica bacterium RIFCSPHIGHO2_12_FULL_44_12]OGW97634.1 MAG: hypothetical protein A3G33_04905 [Omnitrophica bacterium RIFCSPLOWO2_12_FULL_44_17]OGX05170.1 MAG: hypothetical protein A3J12_04425 [Omnitrophica bacterium RIFCSPLOWO2_02_FULL_44_11]